MLVNEKNFAAEARFLFADFELNSNVERDFELVQLVGSVERVAEAVLDDSVVLVVDIGLVLLMVDLAAKLTDLEFAE